MVGFFGMGGDMEGGYGGGMGGIWRGDMGGGLCCSCPAQRFCCHPDVCGFGLLLVGGDAQTSLCPPSPTSSSPSPHSFEGLLSHCPQFCAPRFLSPMRPPSLLPAPPLLPLKPISPLPALPAPFLRPSQCTSVPLPSSPSFPPPAAPSPALQNRNGAGPEVGNVVRKLRDTLCARVTPLPVKYPPIPL